MVKKGSPFRGFAGIRFSPPAEPEPPPSRLALLAGRWRRFIVRRRAAFLMVAGMLAAAAVVLVYGLTRTDSELLTLRDVEAAVARGLEEAPPSFAAAAYEVIRPAVVLVHRPGEEGEENGASVGTGVVVVDSGLILTALHVVGGADTVMVIFADGSESPAAVVSRQPENDLAVLQAMVIPDDLTPATLAGSGRLRVGDQVAAVGHPFGIVNSLSSGVVSGLDRGYVSPYTGTPLSGLIQFDAAVNPGNSGGPLVNRDGEVVGIVTALVNPTDREFFVGIGFAATIETAGGLAGEPVW